MSTEKCTEENCKKLEILGEGSYGKVFKTQLSETLKSELQLNIVAAKINYIENTSDFIGNVRELNHLSTIKHPNLLGILKFIFENPFSDLSPTKKKLKIKYDQVHFLLEPADTSAEDFIYNRKELFDRYNLNWNHLKEIFFQSLLGLEYLHKNGIIHRDIKPGNMLLYLEPPNGSGTRDGWIDPKTIVRGKGRPKSADVSEVSEMESPEPDGNLLLLKICDFGFTKKITNQGRMTKHLYTLSHRAPELYLDLDYNYSADIWALGISFFEIISGKCFLEENEKPSIFIPELLDILPYFVDFRTHHEYITILKNKKITRKNKKKKDFNTWEGLIGETNIKGLNGLDDFIDLLNGMLQFIPEKRLTVSQCIDHKFFDQFKDRISKARLDYPVGMNLGDLPLQHKKVEQRLWMQKLILKTWDNKHNLKKWWKDIIIFHTVDLFDRYINKVEVNWTKEETYHKVLCCMYLFVKFFATTDLIIPFRDIAEEPYVDMRDLSLEFEKNILETFDGRILFDTVYEYSSELTELQVEKLLFFLVGEESNGLTRQEIWKKIL